MNAGPSDRVGAHANTTTQTQEGSDSCAASYARVHVTLAPVERQTGGCVANRSEILLEQVGQLPAELDDAMTVAAAHDLLVDGVGADFDSQTLHYYVEQGLLDPSWESASGPAWAPRHVLQLMAVRVLRAAGLLPAEIAGLVRGVEDEQLAQLCAEPTEASKKAAVMSNWLKMLGRGKKAPARHDQTSLLYGNAPARHFAPPPVGLDSTAVPPPPPVPADAAGKGDDTRRDKKGDSGVTIPLNLPRGGVTMIGRGVKATPATPTDLPGLPEDLPGAAWRRGATRLERPASLSGDETEDAQAASSSSEVAPHVETNGAWRAYSLADGVELRLRGRPAPAALADDDRAALLAEVMRLLDGAG